MWHFFLETSTSMSAYINLRFTCEINKDFYFFFRRCAKCFNSKAILDYCIYGASEKPLIFKTVWEQSQKSSKPSSSVEFNNDANKSNLKVINHSRRSLTVFFIICIELGNHLIKNSIARINLLQVNRKLVTFNKQVYLNI